MSKDRVWILYKKNYLSMIRKSRGSEMFQSFWIQRSGEIRDVLEAGSLSCARFVTCILKIFDLISTTHATVEGTIKDMERSGWFEIEDPIEGSVLVWEQEEFEDGAHKHIGFYVGQWRAISNSEEKRVPAVHHWTYEGKRGVERIYWHNDLGILPLYFYISHAKSLREKMKEPV